MENNNYPGSYYQPLFDLMCHEHGTILTESALTDIIEVVEKMRKAQPGPRWVKASEGLIPDGIHSMKLVSRDDVIMRGTGLVNNNTITLITFLNKTTMGVNDLPKDYEGIYYLDEQPAAGREEDAVDLLRWLNENDWSGVGSGEYINSTTGRVLKEVKLYDEFKKREK